METINKYGGDATLVELPKIEIYGNTHFLMSDLNNAKIAGLLSDWLHTKGLDTKKQEQGKIAFYFPIPLTLLTPFLP